MTASPELAMRLQAQGWNKAITACIAIVCPEPPLEEARTSAEMKVALEKLYQEIRIGDHSLEVWGTRIPTKRGRRPSTL